MPLKNASIAIFCDAVWKAGHRSFIIVHATSAIKLTGLWNEEHKIPVGIGTIKIPHSLITIKYTHTESASL